MVRTSQGDIILNESYRNRLYLKGLLVEEKHVNEGPYAYGYNFANETTPHERNHIHHCAGRHAEAKAIAAMWEAAIMEPNAHPELLEKYTELLFSSFNKKSDDKFDSKKCLLSAPMAEKVWNQLRHMIIDSQEQHKDFF
jgi:hypothetical protein